MENGTTILFVSHDISSIRRFCKRAMWLNRGDLMAIGETNQVADQYEDYLKCLDAEASPDLFRRPQGQEGGGGRCAF